MHNVPYEATVFHIIYLRTVPHIRISGHGIITLASNLLSEHPGKYDVLMANVLSELLSYPNSVSGIKL